MKKRELLFNGKKIDNLKSQIFFSELYGGSSRSAAICGFTYIDNLLNELLNRRLVKDTKLFKKINNLKSIDRINLCYLTGLISKHEKDDLIKINWIRNQFAHKLSLNNFNKQEISDKLKKLNIMDALKSWNSEHFPVNSLREIYISSILAYVLNFHSRLAKINRIREYIKIYPIDF